MTGYLKIRGNLRVPGEASSEPVGQKNIHQYHPQSEENSQLTITWRTNRTVAGVLVQGQKWASKKQEYLG